MLAKEGARLRGKENGAASELTSDDDSDEEDEEPDEVEHRGGPDGVLPTTRKRAVSENHALS